MIMSMMKKFYHFVSNLDTLGNKIKEINPCNPLIVHVLGSNLSTFILIGFKYDFVFAQSRKGEILI